MDNKTSYDELIIIHEFIASFAVVFVASDAFVALVLTIAESFNLSGDLLPITILSFSNSIGDFVTNVTLSKNGFPVMAAAACYAGPLLNIVFDAGLVTFGYYVKYGILSLEVSVGIMSPVGLIFISISLLYTLISMILLYNQARSSVGMVLVFIYCEFLGYVALTELKIIAPFKQDVKVHLERNYSEVVLHETFKGLRLCDSF